MPASRSGARDIPEMQTLIGQEIGCRIIKLDTQNEDVVVDRRVVLEEERAKAKEEKVSALQVGMVVRGTVRSLLDYGAFIDIGGVDGMLHVADISHGRVNKPSDVLTVGQELDVKILKIDPAKKRISLGLKQLQADPWATAAERYHVGDRVKGKVARATDFGAFVELEPGLDGLIHLSEMSWSKKQQKPSDLVKPGDIVEVVVLSVSPADKRISLTLKQALGDPWEEVEKKYPPGSVVEGPVTQLKPFGAFVQVTENIEGMIHVGDIVNDKRINHPQDELKTGQVVRCIVLENDREKRRLRLGLKQLQPTSLDEYIAEHKEGDEVSGRVTESAGDARLWNSVRVCRGHACSRRRSRSRNNNAPPRRMSPRSRPCWRVSGRAVAARNPPPIPARSARRLKPGQIRSFRIARLDPGKKKIDLELAS